MDQVSAVVGGSLDYIIANAGYISTWSAYDSLGDLYVHPQSYPDINMNLEAKSMLSNHRGNDPKRLEEDLLTCFRINVVGNVHLFNLYMPLVLKGDVKKVITLGSGFADNDLTTNYAIDVAGPYTVSKAAMNTVVAKFSAQYGEKGVLFLSIAPGAVEVGQDKDGKESTSTYTPIRESY